MFSHTYRGCIIVVHPKRLIVLTNSLCSFPLPFKTSYHATLLSSIITSCSELANTMWTGMDRLFHLTVQVKPASSARLQSTLVWLFKLGTSSVNTGLIVQVKPASVTPYFCYSFILSSLVFFYIFNLNNWGVWVFVLCVSNISSL